MNIVASVTEKLESNRSAWDGYVMKRDVSYIERRMSSMRVDMDELC